MLARRRAAFALRGALTFSCAVLVHGAVHAVGDRSFVWDSPAHGVMLAVALALLAGVAVPLGLVGPRRERRRRLALVRAAPGPLERAAGSPAAVAGQAVLAAALLAAEGAVARARPAALALASGLVALLCSTLLLAAGGRARRRPAGRAGRPPRPSGRTGRRCAAGARRGCAPAIPTASSSRTGRHRSLPDADPSFRQPAKEGHVPSSFSARPPSRSHCSSPSRSPARAPALAQATTTTLSGTVSDNGAPVAAAAVSASGANLTLSRADRRAGRLPLQRHPDRHVHGRAPARRRATPRCGSTSRAPARSVTLSVAPLRQIGRTSVTARPPVRGSGTDLSLDAEALTRSPAGGSLPNLLVQLPGAARGANGVVHINGDHGDINYIVDGVQIPQALNRTVGTEFDPNDIAFVEALQGAYPAQYGERFASVININSRNGAGPPGFIGDLAYGSYADVDAPSATTPARKRLARRRAAQRAQRPRPRPAQLRLAARPLQRRQPVPAPDAADRAELPQPDRQPLVPDLPDPARRRGRRAGHHRRRPDAGGPVRGGPVPPPDRRPRLALVRPVVQALAHPRLRRPGERLRLRRRRSTRARRPTAPTRCAGRRRSYTQRAAARYSLRDDRTAIDVGGNLDYQNQSAKHDRRLRRATTTPRTSPRATR